MIYALYKLIFRNFFFSQQGDRASECSFNPGTVYRISSTPRHLGASSICKFFCSTWLQKENLKVQCISPSVIYWTFLYSKWKFYQYYFYVLFGCTWYRVILPWVIFAHSFRRLLPLLNLLLLLLFKQNTCTWQFFQNPHFKFAHCHWWQIVLVVKMKCGWKFTHVEDFNFLI